MKMKGIAALAAGALIMMSYSYSSSAIAADVPAAAPQYRYQQQTVKVFDWTGFYVGIDAAYSNTRYNDTAGAGVVVNPNGFSIGASAKYLRQYGRLVVGPEISARWYFADGDTSLFGFVNVNVKDRYSVGTSVLAGYALTERFVPYGHVGYQWKHSDVTLSAFGVSASSPLSMNGLTYGAGAMWALNDRSSLDFRWTRSDGDDNAFGLIGVDSKENRFTLGWNIKFKT